jgi:hypothetical protein
MKPWTPQTKGYRPGFDGAVKEKLPFVGAPDEKRGRPLTTCSLALWRWWSTFLKWTVAPGRTVIVPGSKPFVALACALTGFAALPAGLAPAARPPSAPPRVAAVTRPAVIRIRRTVTSS